MTTKRKPRLKKVLFTVIGILFFTVVAVPLAMDLPVFRGMAAYGKVLADHHRAIENRLTGAKGLLCVTWFPEGSPLPSERWVLYDNGAVRTERILSYSVHGGGFKIPVELARKLIDQVPTLSDSTVGEGFRSDLVVVTDFRKGTDVRFYTRTSLPSSIRLAIRGSHQGAWSRMLDL